jgi:hypothetical protein
VVHLGCRRRTFSICLPWLERLVVARKLLIVLFGVAVSATAILLMRPTVSSTEGDRKSSKHERTVGGKVGTAKGNDDCVGCAIPAP